LTSSCACWQSIGVPKIIVLVFLVVVLAWQAKSCVSKVEAKRAEAARMNARFEARTADMRSPLPLDPYARRAALAEQTRLRPDARFMAAAGQLSGGAIVAAFSDGKWMLTSAKGTPIGSVSELPSFAELMGVLLDLARAQPAAIGDAAAPDAALRWEPQARAGLAPVLKTYAQTHDASALHAAARDAASLVFYRLDSLQVDDDLAAHAMTLVALDQAGGKADTKGEEALLAAALGYGGEARKLGASLPNDKTLSLYLAKDRDGLREAAESAQASHLDRYLWVRQLIEEGSEDDAMAFVDARLGDDRYELAVVQILSEAGDMAHYAAPAFTLPACVLAAAKGVPLTAVLSGGPKKASDELEASLAQVDPDVRGALRAIWLAALGRQGDYIAAGQGDPKLAAEFSAELAKSGSPTVRTFQSYFDLRSKLLSGDPLPAIQSAATLKGIGGTPLVRLVEESEGRADYGDPRLVRAARQLVSRLDSRLEDRRVLARLAWSGLQDLRTTSRMTSSAIAAAPDDAYGLTIWSAKLRGDDATLGRIANDRSLRSHVRVQACEAITDIGERERALRTFIEEKPGAYDAVMELGGLLRGQKRYADAREVLSRWLNDYDGDTIEAGTIRGAASFEAYLLGNYAAGLEDARPALKRVGNASAFQGMLLNLAGLRKAEEARQLADKYLERYPSVHTVAIIAEAEWVLGDFKAAAQRVARSPVPLRADDGRGQLGLGFSRLFGKDPIEAAKATREMVDAGIDASVLDGIAHVLDQQRQFATSVQVRELLKGNPDATLVLRLHAAGSLMESEGEPVAAAYLRAHLPITNDNQARRMMMTGWREANRKLLWDVVPDPSGTGEDAEQIWLMRAAALAGEGKDADPQRIEAARAHYASSSDHSQHAQIGRYLVGQLSEAEAAKLVTNLSAACEVPFYFGVRAQGEGRRLDAADWYSVAVECGLRNEAEYNYAYDALYLWRGGENPLAGFKG
jgi:hypothetical protein